jgi:nitrate/TMAO reductase-like tetraheme cytochrome c subunit
MSGLDQHFGTDASLDAQTSAEILAFLERNAGPQRRSDASQPILRITETAWFKHEHEEELPASIWQHPKVKSPANCGACHTQAENGDYSESTLRVPR